MCFLQLTLVQMEVTWQLALQMVVCTSGTLAQATWKRAY